MKLTDLIEINPDYDLVELEEDNFTVTTVYSKGNMTVNELKSLIVKEIIKDLTSKKPNTEVNLIIEYLKTLYK